MASIRLLIAAALVPILSVVAYQLALNFDGNPEAIDANGSGVGALCMVAFVFAIAWVADKRDWVWRGGTSLGLAAAFFAITWRLWGGVVPSPDAQPDVVRFGLCVAAFSPAVIVMTGSTRLREWWQQRNQLELSS